MQIERIINQHIPADQQAEFDHGRVLSLLMAARLYSPVALDNVAEWAGESGADLLWGMPLEKINDDRLGRSLDAFFTQRHSILASLALHVAQEFDVPLNDVHYDPTHIVFHGAYESSQPRAGVVGDGVVRSDDLLDPAHITKGRAGQDTPDGVQLVHAGLFTHVDEYGPLPIYGHTVDGNQNGRTAVREGWELVRQRLKPQKLTMISDRGTFSAGHLARLREADCRAICSAPWNEFRPLFDAQFKRLKWKQASYLSIEQQRRRDTNSELPREHYELAVVKHSLEHEGATIPCRVIFVFSTADQKVVRKQREKQITKLREGLQKLQKSVAEGRRNTDPASVSRRVNKLLGKKQAAKYFQWELIPLNKKEQASLPKPQSGCKRPTNRFHFTFDSRERRRDEQYDGYSALVTTVPLQEGSADLLFTKFKQQCYSEQVNSQFKGPLAVHPVFLKSPLRVEALVFLMIATLMVYYLLQRMYRQSLPDTASTKQRRTTSKTLLRAFSTYIVFIHRTPLGREVRPSRPTKRQTEILRQLGLPSPAQRLRTRLPRAPTR
ncbi:MAG: IS1634 family transposase [Pirellulaceae bacterium]